jgi:hypothetical protein
MTTLVIPIRREPILKIMEHLAPKAPDGPESNSFNAAPLTGIDGALAEAWDQITDLVTRTLRDGWVNARAEIARVTRYIKDRAEELGQGAKELLDRVLDKIREAITGTIDFMLQSLRTELTIGAQGYVLESIDIENKFTMSGELSVSLESLCKLVGEGELAVKGKYRVRGSKAP